MHVFHRRRRNDRKTFRGSLARFRRLNRSITRRRIGYQGLKQMLGGMSDIVHGAIERFLVRLGRFRKAAQFSDELE
jgi:hypothetical protein